MNTVCPACGVAVVPGYVRCPKCHARLSLGGPRTQRSTVDPGGTALERKSFPTSAVIVALGVAAAIILVFGVRSGSKKTEAAAPAAELIEATHPNPSPRVILPAAAQGPAPTDPKIAPQDPAAAASDVEDTLRKQRLWGRVVISGQRIDVRSGSCGAPEMRSMIDGKTPLLRSTGLTKLRCLEQSGAVVFERDL